LTEIKKTVRGLSNHLEMSEMDMKMQIIVRNWWWWNNPREEFVRC